MTVLVTGGAGFIGAAVTHELVARGDEQVHVTYRSGALQRLADVRDEVVLHPLDLAETAQIDAVVDAVKPRAVYHLGAMLGGPSMQDPQGSLRTNAYGTHALLEASRRAGAEQFIFASSLGAFLGRDLPAGPLTDFTVQRPDTIYGVGKVFGELLGRYYRHAGEIDFRSLRYPSIVGPGVTTWSAVQYTSWAIEKTARGEPFTIWVPEDFAAALVYFKEAGKAMVQLADAPQDAIKTVNYNVNGIQPPPTAGEIADLVRARIPDAKVTIEPDPALHMLYENPLPPIDDSSARAEWGWCPSYDYPIMIDEFLAELHDHPDLYR